MSLDLSPRPGAAPRAAMLRSQISMELRLLSRNGEQLLLTLIIPLMLLILGTRSNEVVDLGAGRPIDIITPGWDIDAHIVRAVGKSRWKPLLEAGARFYEYQPARFHCIYLLVDDCWASCSTRISWRNTRGFLMTTKSTPARSRWRTGSADR